MRIEQFARTSDLAMGYARIWSSTLRGLTLTLCALEQVVRVSRPVPHWEPCPPPQYDWRFFFSSTPAPYACLVHCHCACGTPLQYHRPAVNCDYVLTRRSLSTIRSHCAFRYITKRSLRVHAIVQHSPSFNHPPAVYQLLCVWSVRVTTGASGSGMRSTVVDMEIRSHVWRPRALAMQPWVSGTHMHLCAAARQSHRIKMCTACNDYLRSVRAEGAGPGHLTGFPCPQQ